MLSRVRNPKVMLSRSVEIILIYFFNQAGAGMVAIGHNVRPIFRGKVHTSVEVREPSCCDPLKIQKLAFNWLLKTPFGILFHHVKK